MAVGIGQALALGNLAQVDRSKPFTNAVMNKQRLDLAQQERKAKDKQQAIEQQKYLNSLLKFGEGGFSPFYQEEAARIASEGLQEQLRYRDQGNQIGQMNEGAKMKARLDDLKEQDEATSKFLALKKEGFLIPKELEQGFSGIRSQNEKGIQDFLSKNPQWSEVVGYDPVTKSYKFNPVKDIDLNKAYDASIRENESQMTESKFLRQIDNNTNLYEFSLSPQQVQNIALSYGTNSEYVRNLKLKEPEKFNQELTRVQKSMPELSPEQQQTIVASKIAEENLQTRNKKAHVDTKAQPNIFNFGGSYSVSGKTFNPSLAPADQNIDAYVAAGVLTAQEAQYYKTALKSNPNVAQDALANVPDLLAIDPPNTGTFTVKDEKGKTFKADNMKAVYVPKVENGKGGQWFMAGSKQDGTKSKPVFIPINENTYGNLISVYGKMTLSDIEKLLNTRMKDGGITNDSFKLSVLKPNQQSSKQSTKKKISGF